MRSSAATSTPKDSPSWNTNEKLGNSLRPGSSGTEPPKALTRCARPIGVPSSRRAAGATHRRWAGPLPLRPAFGCTPRPPRRCGLVMQPPQHRGTRRTPREGSSQGSTAGQGAVHGEGSVGGCYDQLRRPRFTPRPGAPDQTFRRRRTNPMARQQRAASTTSSATTRAAGLTNDHRTYHAHRHPPTTNGGTHLPRQHQHQQRRPTPTQPTPPPRQAHPHSPPTLTPPSHHPHTAPANNQPAVRRRFFRRVGRRDPGNALGFGLHPRFGAPTTCVFAGGFRVV